MSPARQTPVSFPSGTLSLEGVVTILSGDARSVPGVVVCHPEPHLGGTMDSAVVQTLARRLAEDGLASLRFNYRGVGGSGGDSGLGPGELEDARAAIKLIRSWPGVDKNRVAIVGYSFGAGIAARVALKDRKAVAASVVISPPLTLPPLGLQGVPARDLRGMERPMLFVIGEKDGLTAPTQLREWVGSFQNPRLQVAVLPDADRSWQGKRQDLADKVAGFLTQCLVPRADR